jgi:hypothetical protein
VLLHHLSIRREVLSKLRLLKHMRLWSKVGKSMGLHRPRARGPCPWWHLPHHRRTLSYLRTTRCRNSRMHLLHHRTRVSIRVLARGQSMARGKTGVLRNA